MPVSVPMATEQAPVEHVLEQAHHHELLLEDPQDLADRARRRRTPTTISDVPADEHLVVVALLAAQGVEGGPHEHRATGVAPRGRTPPSRVESRPSPASASVRPVSSTASCTPAALTTSSSTSCSSSRVCFSMAPLDSTSTASTTRGLSDTSWTERTVATSCGGPDHHRGVAGQARRAGGWCRPASARARRGSGRRRTAPAGSSVGAQRRRAPRGGRRRTGSPSRWGSDRRWCGAGPGTPRPRGWPCRCGPSPRRRSPRRACATWPGADRLGRLDVLGDDRPQDGGLAFVEHGNRRGRGSGAADAAGAAPGSMLPGQPAMVAAAGRVHARRRQARARECQRRRDGSVVEAEGGDERLLGDLDPPDVLHALLALLLLLEQLALAA